MMFMLHRPVFRHFRITPPTFLAAIGWRDRRHIARHNLKILTLGEVRGDNARLSERLPMMCNRLWVNSPTTPPRARQIHPGNRTLRLPAGAAESWQQETIALQKTALVYSITSSARVGMSVVPKE